MSWWESAPVVGGNWWESAPVVGDAKPERDVVATTDDGGIVFKTDTGALGFTSPGYSTNDPDRIAKIMEGATPADMMQGDIDAERIAQNPIAARAGKVIEGVPFVGSYADEAVGAISPTAAENMRATSRAMDRQNPNESAALKFGGAIAGSVPMAIAAGPSFIANQAKTLGGRALQAGAVGAAVGGVEGAVYGAGQQDGGRGDNAAQGAIFGTLAGGVLGAAAPYAAEGIKRALVQMKGSDVSAIGRALGISPKAARVVKNALDAGDMDEAMRALDKSGAGAMLADAGQPARELLDAAASTGGAAGKVARDAVEGRVTRVSKELTATLDNAFGSPAGIKSLGRGVRESTAAAREAAYSAAYSKPIDYSASRGALLERLLRRVPKSAIDDANALMTAEGIQSKQILAKVTDSGEIVLDRLPDVRQIDYITRALQGVADKADGQGKLGGTTPLGKAYADLSRNLRNALKGEVPEYAKALDVAGDAIRTVKSGETGYSLMRAGTTRETVSEALRGASKSERDAMKMGVRSYIDDTLANVTRTITDPNTDAREALKVIRDMSSRSNQSKIRMLLGKTASDALFDDLEKATVAFELRAALAQNSKTAIRQSIQSGVKQQATGGALEVLAEGKPVQAGQRFVQLFTGSSDEAQALRESGIFEEIATALTQTKGFKAKTALKLVDSAMKGQKISEQQAAFIGTVIAESGVLVGSREASRRLTTQ